MPFLGIHPDRESQLNVWQRFTTAFLPARCTFAAWGLVPTLGIKTGKAKAHGRYRKQALVIKLRLADPEPVAKTVTAGVRKGPAGGLNTGPRCLSDNTYHGMFAAGQNRTYWVIKMGLAHRTGARLASNDLKPITGHSLLSGSASR